MLNPTFSDKKQSNVKTSAPLSGDSYKSLQDMVEVTAAMAEEAVSCSPNRARTILRNMDSEYNIEQFRRLVFKYQKTKKGKIPQLTCTSIPRINFPGLFLTVYLQIIIDRYFNSS